jgi:UrcA family protein
MRRFFALSITAALSIAAAATPATARDGAVSIVVPTHDLNLTSAAGQRALDGRINRAARQLCATGDRSLRAITAENACIAAVRESADAQLAGATTIAMRLRAPRG